MTVQVIREEEAARLEVCDHEGTTKPLDGDEGISKCSACGHIWPARFGAAAPLTRIVEKEGAESWDS